MFLEVGEKCFCQAEKQDLGLWASPKYSCVCLEFWPSRMGVSMAWVLAAA